MVEAFISGKGNVDFESYLISGDDDVSSLPESVELLKIMIKEIENAVSHLERSNKEIMEFDPEKKDPDLQSAVIENVQAIATKNRRKDRCIERLSQLCPNATTTRLDEARSKEFGGIAL